MTAIRKWMTRGARLVVIGLGLLLWAPGAHAADSPGRMLYVKYCGACHGPNGKGDGVVATFMTPKPTDLTQIAKGHGGTFPTMEVMQGIDGTKTVRAHGEPTMPVWGELFKDDVSYGMDQRTAIVGRVMLLTEYLRSIQEK